MACTMNCIINFCVKFVFKVDLDKIHFYAHVKHVVGELEYGSDDFFESFSTKFA